MHLFEGNKAEAKTFIPVLTAFQDRHAATDIVVVADAGTLSAANLLALEEAGFAFIVGSSGRHRTSCSLPSKQVPCSDDGWNPLSMCEGFQVSAITAVGRSWCLWSRWRCGRGSCKIRL